MDYWNDYDMTIIAIMIGYCHNYDCVWNMMEFVIFPTTPCGTEVCVDHVHRGPSSTKRWETF